MFRRSSRFVFLTLAVIGGVCLVMWAIPVLQLSGYRPGRVAPGRVNLIAVQRGAGYRITISNGIAHLVEGDPAAFDAPEAEPTEGAARLPIRETLAALQGDVVALGKMVMSVNDMRTEELPSVQVVWKAEDIRKAVTGDAALRQKLERDINTRLDGTPLGTVDADAIINGIVVDAPVAVQVPTPDGLKQLVCRVREPYKSLFAGAVEDQLNQRFNVTRDALVGLYRTQANKVLAGRREDVAASLLSRTSPETLQQRAVKPEGILSNIKVLVNESHMTGASFQTYEGPNRSILCDVTLNLTQEGRMRLWKYSHDHPGFQLLLTVDGIAIAAPKITSALSGAEVKLTRVPSREQVEDAVAFIKRAATGS